MRLCSKLSLISLDGEAANGKSRGLALFHAFGSYVAACADVTVDGSGDLSINRIVAATDCGTAVNPQQIEAQIEGSFVYGLSAALYGEITYENGQVQQDNFHTYPSMRIKDMPDVQSIVMPSGGFYGGVGEPTIFCCCPRGIECDLCSHWHQNPNITSQGSKTKSMMASCRKTTVPMLAPLLLLSLGGCAGSGAEC